MAKVRDKEFRVMYDAYKVDLRSTVFLEAGNILKLSPGDMVIYMADIPAYLYMSPEEFDKRFDLVSEG